MDALNSFWELVGQVLRLDTSAVSRYIGQPGSGQLAVAMVLIAGLSEAVGNSVVLFVNRVRPVRFLLTLVVVSIVFAFTYLFWTLTVHLIARFAFSVSVSYTVVAELVAFGFAPRVFGFLEFMPVLGRPVASLLRIWSLLAVLLLVATILALSPWQALATVALGAVALLTLQQTVGRPLLNMGNWLQRRAAGVNLVLDRKGLRELVRKPRKEQRR